MARMANGIPREIPRMVPRECVLDVTAAGDDVGEAARDSVVDLELGVEVDC